MDVAHSLVIYPESPPPISWVADCSGVLPLEVCIELSSSLHYLFVHRVGTGSLSMNRVSALGGSCVEAI